MKVCVSIDCESPGPTGNGEVPPLVSGYSETVGDGTNTSFTVTHGLDSDFVVTSVRHVPSGEIRNVSPAVTVLDRNSVRLDFSAAPSVDEYSVYVLALKM